MQRWGKRGLMVALAMTLASTGCAGAGGGGGGGGAAGGGDANSISVLMVNNPQMADLQTLTADNFTKQTGITVNFTVLPENDVRDKISQEFSSQAGQYDVATVSNFEIPIYAKSKWIAPMDDFIAKDAAFDQADILKPMATSLSADGKIYGQPFYGESSFLMYRKDVFDAAGLTMPANPTWQEVADLAAKVDGAQPGMKGICLRGQPGWGQVFAPLTTVVNTFGGTWFNQDWTPGVNAPEFKEATNFYVDLVKAHGENGAPQAGFTECLNNMTQGATAMWYDATSAAGSLEAADSPVKGKIAYVPAPVVKTKASGWLYAWAWGIQQASKKQDSAWKFISWASGKDYEKLVGTQLGWSKVPAGKRSSTYDIPEYVAEAKAFAEPTQSAIESADPTNPGVQPPARPRVSSSSASPSSPTSARRCRRTSAPPSPVRRPSTPRWTRDRRPPRPSPRSTSRSRTRRSGKRQRDDQRAGGGSMSTTVDRKSGAGEKTPAPDGGASSALRRSGDWARRAPLLPALIFMIIVTQLPFVGTLIISFMNWNTYYPDDIGFAGLANFGSVLSDPNTRSAIFVTILLTASVVLVSLVLGTIIALLLDRTFLGRGIVRTMMITPFLIVPVAAALLWKHALYNPNYGLFNGLLRGIFGADAAQPDWISELPLTSVVAALVWQWTPFMMLIILAGLQGRPLDVIEAARIDGCSAWQVFRYMTFPHLRQYLELGGLLGSIYIVQNFDAVFTITSGGLGTANLPYVIYQIFYTAHDYGRASAAGVVVVIGTIVIATFALRTVSSLFKEESR